MKLKGTMNPIKPNLLMVIVAMLIMAWIGYKIYENMFGALAALSGVVSDDAGQTVAAATGNVKDKMIQVLLHILAGTLILPIITVLGGMGIKLLDEKPGRTVPAETHELLMNQIESKDALMMRMLSEGPTPDPSAEHLRKIKQIAQEIPDA